MKKLEPNPWYKHAVVYEIYPLSFKDSNGDGLGDLEGVISKLDYLEELGVNAIWLTPVFTSPLKDFGYDVSDYCNIGAQFGTLEIFDKLIEAAHNKNIRVIIDLVANHTSTEHPWFIESRLSKNSPKRDWYIWHDPKPDGRAPNNWRNVSDGTSAWTLDKKTGQYYLHQFLPSQPDLNWRNLEVQESMRNVLRFWMKRGVDGFRIDALGHIIEDREFRDEPKVSRWKRSYYEHEYFGLHHIYTKHQPELRNVIQILSKTAKEYKDVFLIGEVYAEIELLAEFYTYSPHNNLAPFNFNLLEKSWTTANVRNTIEKYEEMLRPEDIQIFALGNHDVSRFISRSKRELARIAALLLFMLPGTAFIYYGEELGLENTPSIEMYFDRDRVRVPMPWDGTRNTGFTEGTPSIPVEKNPKLINVGHQQKNPSSMLSFYKRLIGFRNASHILSDGLYVSTGSKSKKTFSFIRQKDNQRLLIILNFSNKQQKETLPGGFSQIVFSTESEEYTGGIRENSLTLRPYEGLVVQYIGEKIRA